MKKTEMYLSPELEIIEVGVENGFTASYGTSDLDDFDFGGDLSNY